MSRSKIELRPKDYQKIRTLAERGVRQTDICKALGISYKTWLRLKQEDKQALEAFEEARTIEEEQLVGMLYEKAMSGDSTSAMFLLKTRHGYKEGKEQTTNAVQVNISVPGSMNPEDYKKMTEVASESE